MTDQIPELPTIKGRTVVLTVFGLAITMSAGAWFYHFQAVRRATEFWGPSAARLLVESPQVLMLSLGPLQSEAIVPSPLVGRSVEQVTDLSTERGLVHFRHALTQDANYLWDQRWAEGVDDREWAIVLQFVDSARNEQLQVALTADARFLGKLGPEGQKAEVVACPRMAHALLGYLEGVLASAEPSKQPEDIDLPASTL